MKNNMIKVEVVSSISTQELEENGQSIQCDETFNGSNKSKKKRKVNNFWKTCLVFTIYYSSYTE